MLAVKTDILFPDGVECQAYKKMHAEDGFTGDEVRGGYGGADSTVRRRRTQPVAAVFNGGMLNGMGMNQHI
jgi:hypothetical protein